MSPDDVIEKKRKEVLEKISSIRTMRKGVVSDYYVNTKLKNGSVNANGPYYALTSKGPNGKTVGEKIPSDMVEDVIADTENYKKFRELSDEYVSVCEQQSIHLSSDSTEAEKLKKNKRSK